MKNLYLIFLFFPIFVSGQLYIDIANHRFQDFEYRPCPYDESTTLYLPVGWELYRTLNDEWDGLRDSTACIGLVPDSNDATLSIVGMSTTRPVFLRALITDENKPQLTPNWTYDISFYIQYNASGILDFQCADGDCSKLILGVEIPNADTTGTVLRQYDIEASSGQYEFCMGTEYFEENYLREVVLQLNFRQDTLTEHEVTFREFFSIPSFTVNLLPETVVAPPWSFDGDSTYTFSLNEAMGSTNYSGFLLTHDENSYPEIGNTTYYELAPAFPSEGQQTLNVYVDEAFPLIFAPFTSIRGSLREGSDSLRNTIHLFLPDQEICLPFVDIGFDTPVFLHPGSSGISFFSQQSCFSFSHGAQLAIGQDMDIVYGENSIGQLALGVDGRIVLEPNSSLMINNLLGLLDHHGLPTDQAWVELPRGSRLSFGPDARLMKKGAFAETGYMKLNVLMNGGELDDHYLSPEERSLINRVYPPGITHTTHPIRIMTNPVNQQLDYELTIPAETTFQWHLINAHGRTVKQGQKGAPKGISFHSIPVDDLPSGIYCLQVKVNNQFVVEKIVVI